MTPKQRLMKRLKGEPVDKIPNLNIVMQFAAEYAGVPYGQFCADYKALVKAQAKTAVDFGLDILSTMSDPFRETNDFGALISFREDSLPVCEAAFLTDPDDLHKLKLFDPMTSTRMLDRIRAVELFKQEFGDEYAILGWVEAPFAEFCDLTTVSEGMAMLYDEPEMVEEALEILTQQAILCAKAQLDAGADVIGMGDAVASLVSPTSYKSIAMPYEKRVIDAVHAHGGLVKLHICGNTNHILADMIATGADIVDIDHMVDMERAIELSKGKCSICGHFDPVSIVFNGTPEGVRAATRADVQAGNTRSLISAGCEIPKSTPHENLLAVDAQLKEMAQ